MLGRKASSGHQNRRITTIIGDDTQISGSITSSGVVRIDGRFEGDIHTETDVVVGERGYLKARVEAAGMSVAGEVHGDLHLSGRLEILATGKVFGEIRVSALAIEEGGVFKGKCDMGKPDGENDEPVYRQIEVGTDDQVTLNDTAE
ncbi:MAG: polymer-forming cytoskeletal protein [Bacillota bacterium]